MEFRTKVEIPKASFEIPPCERMLFVGSCFADNIGKRFQEEKFRAQVNPFGVMYNPASILHTVERLSQSFSKEENVPNISVFTLGTNHVYLLKETGEIVDNCEKRPQSLFEERQLNVEECASYLEKAIKILADLNASSRIILTVSPIRYRKYGYHGSQLSKSILLLAVEKVIKENPSACYFPAYEIMNDELRDYRFYKEDMLHPSEQAVEYIWERFSETYFSKETKDFLKEWKPLKEALNHRPFHPESDEYKQFMDKTMLRVKALSKKYPNFAL
jgi:hypothetical protein